MVNFSEVSGSSVAGRVMRRALSLIPDQTVVPVLQGPLRGSRWIVGSAPHGCWLGSYEANKQLEMKAAIRPGSVVYDVGANVGFYTLLAARLVGTGGFVYAFEPSPRNIKVLERHLALNNIGNVKLFRAAVSACPGKMSFDQGECSLTGRLSDSGALLVEVVSLDDLVKKGAAKPPAVLKIDVEGAELDVLRGARATLEQYRPVVFLATHGKAAYDACCELLRSYGYGVRILVEEEEVIGQWVRA